MKEIKRISIIGTGRVAHQIAQALFDKGYDISGVYGRSNLSAQKLADKVNAQVIRDLSIPFRSDLALVCVSDDAIADVTSRISNRSDAIIAHTSGAVPMTVIPSDLKRGVFYPLQSFSIGKKVVWENVPFCIEADDNDHVNALGQVAESLSDKIFILSSDQRKALHLAAVFANNFANLMFEYSEELLLNAEIDRSILHPLILETANKVLLQKASESRTGPASRGDLKTINAHRELLGEEGSLREVYDLLTREIYNRNHDQKL